MFTERFPRAVEIQIELGICEEEREELVDVDGEYLVCQLFAFVVGPPSLERHGSYRILT